MHDDLRPLLVSALADAETVWSLGGFGALAEFRWDAAEATAPPEDGRIGRITPRGGIALDPGAPIVPVAYETALPGGWSHAVALCLPRAACIVTPSRSLAEIGSDTASLRARDSDACLFDLGLALPQAAIHLRTRDAAMIARLRRASGRDSFAPESPVPSLLAEGALDLVVVTPLGRMEVFARSGPPTPGTPRGFVVPRIVRLGRTHAATAPIPDGLVPCAHLHPPHPCRDGSGQAIAFRRDRHAAFQALLARWGDPRHLALKRVVWSGRNPTPAGGDRHGRGAARVARVQAAIVPDQAGSRPDCAGAGRDKSCADTAP